MGVRYLSGWHRLLVQTCEHASNGLKRGRLDGSLALMSREQTMDERTFDFTPDRRRQQVMAVIALIMDAIGKHIPDDGHSRKHATYDLLDALDGAGIDIITNDDRAKAGLPPRGPKGWTDQELKILDLKRMEAMLAPMPPLIVPRL